MNVVHLCDCMDIMRNMSDKSVDLCITDPPYGIDAGTYGCGSRERKYDRSNAHNWDSAPPTQKYWDELFRISKNQIIWGMNNYTLPPCKHFVVWDKKQPDGVTFAQAELAWTSFDGTSKIFKQSANGQVNRIHPTQKPVALYKWLLKNYAKPGDKIFDSHVGSGSIRIACHDMGFDFEGCEIDKDYWEAQEKRYQQHIMQGDLFSSEDTQKAIYQGVLF